MKRALAERETRLTVRLPDAVAEWLRTLAREHKRSLNAEIVWGLQDYVRRETRQQPRKTDQ